MSAVIRPLTNADLPQARRICCTAFGTFLGAPDPENFWADRDYVYGRFGAEHVASFAAELDGELVGSNFATRWGSFGFFGPITMRPERQGRGIGKALVEAVSNQFEDWGVSHAGLCTFPAEPAAHRALRQIRVPRAVSDPDHGGAGAAAGDAGSWSRYGELPDGDRRAVEAACRELTDMLYDGLDLGAEIRTVAARGLGDTLAVVGGREPARRVCGVPLGAGERGRRGLLLCQIRRGAAGRRGRGALRRTPRRLRLARRRGRHAEPVGRRQSRPRGGLSADGGARLPRRDPGRHDAPAERGGLQPARPLRPRRLALAAAATVFRIWKSPSSYCIVSGDTSPGRGGSDGRWTHISAAGIGLGERPFAKGGRATARLGREINLEARFRCKLAAAAANSLLLIQSLVAGTGHCGAGIGQR